MTGEGRVGIVGACCLFIGLRLAPRAPFHRGSCAVNPASACGGVTARGKFEKNLVGDVKVRGRVVGRGWYGFSGRRIRA